MNIDLSSAISFNDASGLRDFMLVHRFVHDQTASALTARFHVAVSTLGLLDAIAEEVWVQLMREGKTPPKVPEVLQNWLQIHSDMHTQSYSLLSSTGTVAPDLSVVDFSQAKQFEDWMFVHQQMHDFEQQQLGLT